MVDRQKCFEMQLLKLVFFQCLFCIEAFDDNQRSQGGSGNAPIILNRKRGKKWTQKTFLTTKNLSSFGIPLIDLKLVYVLMLCVKIIFSLFLMRLYRSTITFYHTFGINFSKQFCSHLFLNDLVFYFQNYIS
jgi:hypothetical protein